MNLIHRRTICRAIGLLTLTWALSPTPSVQANERRFAYAYESGVMAPGTRELEYWSTWRGGRAEFYSRFDHRLELELGLTDRLLTALYLNWRSISRNDPANPDTTVTEQEFTGISSEWKYKLADPVADPVGAALYQEYTLASDEFEWESKLILDKKLGGTLLAYNLVVEPEWKFGPANSEWELWVENVLGATHFVTPRFAAGLELRNPNLKTRGSAGLRHSALFLGPTLSYAAKDWWLAAAFLKQLPAPKRSLANRQDSLVLDEHEKTNIRVLAAFRF
ncbi:MAG: hypothetical protein A2X36_00095 [Elusimicrobia bacterium GWA2_69_24]|nr:MAG: hypothetical protein A2X36_00095 [Elusimicrobia bacterium GWA2_69_24]HBL19079.1 hypothetical protein [Elusimicrobiota bacterium]